MVRIVDVEGMITAGEDILGVLCIRLLDLEGLFVLVSCLQLATNLSRVGISPSIYLFALSESHSMLSTAHNLLDSDFRSLIEDILRNFRGCQHFASGMATDHVLKQ